MFGNKKSSIKPIINTAIMNIINAIITIAIVLNQLVLNITLKVPNQAIIDNVRDIEIVERLLIALPKNIMLMKNTVININGPTKVASIALPNPMFPIVSILADMYTGIVTIIHVPKNINKGIKGSIFINLLIIE